MSKHRLTIGIEEEYQIVHPETRELHSYIQEFLDGGKMILGDQIKPEFLQSQVEVGSNVWVEIYYQREMHWNREMAKATVVDKPFWFPPRRSATPPEPY